MVADLHHVEGLSGETQVVRRCHIEDPVHADHIFRLFDSVTDLGLLRRAYFVTTSR